MIKRRLLLTCIVASLFIGCIVTLQVFLGFGKVNAVAVAPECQGGRLPQSNRFPCVGYFTGDNFNTLDNGNSAPYRWDVLINGTSGASQDRFLNPNGSLAVNGAEFIASIKGYLAQGSATTYNSNAAGAAFIIDNMLGQPGNAFGSSPNGWQAGYTYAENNLTDWEQRVLYYDSQGWVNWTENVSFPTGTTDSAHECKTSGNPDLINCGNANDDYKDFAFTHNVNVEQDTIIDFHVPGSAAYFRIRRTCGNLIGTNMGPLQQPAPYNLQPTVAPVIPSGATVATPGETVQFNFGVTNVGQNVSPKDIVCNNYLSVHPGVYQPGPGVYDGGATGNPPPNCQGKAFPANNTMIGVGSAGVPITGADAGQSVCETLTVFPADVANDTHKAEKCVYVAYIPYFTELGGDVAAGPGFGTGCTTNNSAAIMGENEGASGSYFGASSRQGAIATGLITQFATDTTNVMATNLGGSTDGLTAGQPGRLAFSNQSPPAGSYGGNYLGAASQNWCVPNYANVTAAGAFNPGNLTTGVYRLTGTNIPSLTIPAGARVTVVATGDVHINGDIKYAAYGSATQIPQFTLVDTGGNVYIDSSVQELHGFYDAQPGPGGAGGTIYTCANGGVAAYNYATCNNPLTIYGAVSANKIVPGRTYGNITKSGVVSDYPAEQFVYTPELWLGTLTQTGQSCAQDPNQSQCMYQSYTSLPPVL